MRQLLLLTFAALANCQTSGSLKFEGADIHPCPRSAGLQLDGPFRGGGLYKLRSATMVDLIGIAYGVEADGVAGGPIWLEVDRFDVIAKPPAGSTTEAIKLMLRSLLEDRFHLVVRQSTQPRRASELRTSSHVQMKRADAGQSFCGYFHPESGAASRTSTVLRCRNMRMADFAEQIRNIGRQGLFRSQLPVIDRTELQGGWDFEFLYDPQLAAIDDNTYLSRVLEKQVGLKLEESRIPTRAIEVQSADRTPTANAPDLAKVIPPPPTEFEAAEIKPADTTAGAGGRSEFRNGRVLMTQTTVANLIGMAWSVSPDEITGLPKWATTERIDLVAKGPAELSVEADATRAAFLALDTEMLRAPIRTLLLERYKMRVHFEDSPRHGYALLAVKPKLEAADPTAHSRCHEGRPANAGNRVAGWPVTCENVTMEQFAQYLGSHGASNTHDATGLKGQWQFSFDYYPQWRLDALAKLAGGEADPVGGYSIFDAVSKQLGLKLREQDWPKAVFVVDEMEK